MTNDELIVKHLEGWDGLALESVKHYGETGHISGSLLLALRRLLVEKENEVKNLSLPQVSKCEDVEREPAVCDKCNKLKMFVKKPAHCKYCGCRLYT